MKHLKTILTATVSALLLGLVLVTSAQAADPVSVTVEWDWPTLTCDGGAISLGEIQQAEIYISTAAIPSVTDTEGPCSGVEDVPPTGAILQTVTTDDTSVQIPLEPGATYHIRMRVQVNGVWSNLSAEAVKEVTFSKPQVPIIIRIS